jgi:hypothetical protein
MLIDVEVHGIFWGTGTGGVHTLKPAKGTIGDYQTLMKDPRFRDLSNNFYQDHFAVMTVAEVIFLATQHYKDDTESINTFEQSLLGAAFALVHILEWETGLNVD